MLIFKTPYAKNGKTKGNAKYIGKRCGVDKSINNIVVNNLDYIATRPRAEKLGTHGLFSSYDNVSLPEVERELENHSGYE